MLRIFGTPLHAGPVRVPVNIGPAEARESVVRGCHEVTGIRPCWRRPQTRAQYDALHLEQLIGQAIYRGEMIRLADLSHIAPPDWGRPRRIQAWQTLQYSGRACLRQFRRTPYIQLTSLPHLPPPAEAKGEKRALGDK
ncbi:hypothetical protein D3C87_1697010 [compost metagenome]